VRQPRSARITAKVEDTLAQLEFLIAAIEAGLGEYLGHPGEEILVLELVHRNIDRQRNCAGAISPSSGSSQPMSASAPSIRPHARSTFGG
jgi:hypothetical protein